MCLGPSPIPTFTMDGKSAFANEYSSIEIIGMALHIDNVQKLANLLYRLPVTLSTPAVRPAWHCSFTMKCGGSCISKWLLLLLLFQDATLTELSHSFLIFWFKIFFFPKHISSYLFWNDKVIFYYEMFLVCMIFPAVKQLSYHSDTWPLGKLH